MSNDLGRLVKYFSRGAKLSNQFLQDLFTKLHTSGADYLHIATFLTTLDTANLDSSLYDELINFIAKSKFHESQSNEEIAVFELDDSNLIKLLPSLLLIAFLGYKILIVIKHSDRGHNFSQMMHLDSSYDHEKIVKIISDFNITIIENNDFLYNKSYEEIIKTTAFGDHYSIINLIATPYRLRGLFLDRSVLSITRDIEKFKFCKIYTMDNERHQFIINVSSFNEEIFKVSDVKSLYKVIITEIDAVDKTDIESSWIKQSAVKILEEVFGVSKQKAYKLIINKLKEQSFLTYLEEMRTALIKY